MSSLTARSVAALALALTLGACSSQSGPTPTASPSGSIPAAVAALPVLAPAVSPEMTPSATPTADPVEATPEDASAADASAARKVFSDYNQALLARDFATVCPMLDPSASAALISALNDQGSAVSDCRAAFGAVYANASAATALDEAARSLTITDVSVAGDTATITFSGGQNGNTVSGLTNKLTRTGGAWLILPVNA